MRLTILFLFLSFSAFGQDTLKLWGDPMELPIKQPPLTIVSSVNQLVAFELKPGMTYTITETPTAPFVVPALSFVTQSGIVPGSDYIGSADAGDFVSYNVSMGGRTKVKVDYARQWGSPAQGIAEVRAGGVNGEILGTIITPNTGAWGSYSTVVTNISPTTLNTVFIVFKTTGTGNIKKFTFE